MLECSRIENTLYWKCMHTVGEPVAQTLFCRSWFLLTTQSLYIALTQQNLLLVSNGCLPIHLQVGYSWSSQKRPTLLIQNRHLIWQRGKEIKAVLVLPLNVLRVVWRSEIYTLMALLSSFWFHKCSSYKNSAAPTIAVFLSFLPPPVLLMLMLSNLMLAVLM